MYRVNEIRLSVGEEKMRIPEKIQKKLKLKEEIVQYNIIRESIDARDKREIKYIYTVDFETKGNHPELEKAPDIAYRYPRPGEGLMKNRPVIAGFGPCGMFAGLILAECGFAPLILERGKPAAERVRDVSRFWREGVLSEDSNVQFGEGGAGAFSDGKLTTGIRDPRVRKVLEELAAAGAGEEVLYKQKPHVGTDVLRDVVVNLRKKILERGGEVLFETRLEGFAVGGTGRLEKVFVRSLKGGAEETIPVQHLILATGHSARDTVRSLFVGGLAMVQKPFSIGLRIEHPQILIDEAQYGKKYAGLLPPAEYKLAYRCGNGRGVYTFCMCPGGEVIVASSQKGGVVTNGMSGSRRDGAFANSGLLADVRTSDFGADHPLAGIAFQEKYEKFAFALGGGNYKAPAASWGDFRRGAAEAVIGSLPLFAAESIQEAMPHFGKRIKGFDGENAWLTAVESRSSSPVRIPRDERFQSNIPGIYPGGEGAGYAGGIVSSAVDGIRIAEEIVKNYTGQGTAYQV